jgi:hypothetical protein
MPRPDGFLSERDLEDRIFEVLSGRTSDKQFALHRQRSFTSSLLPDRTDRPDIIIETSSRIIIIEIKLYRGEEHDVSHISRYVGNSEIKNVLLLEV